jgi:CheY-like chemotaxis protein
MTVTGEAGNRREAVDLWKQHHPDVTQCDLRMLEIHGVGVINEIRSDNEKAPIIVHCISRPKLADRVSGETSISGK